QGLPDHLLRPCARVQIPFRCEQPQPGAQTLERLVLSRPLVKCLFRFGPFLMQMIPLLRGAWDTVMGRLIVGLLSLLSEVEGLRCLMVSLTDTAPGTMQSVEMITLANGAGPALLLP